MVAQIHYGMVMRIYEEMQVDRWLSAALFYSCILSVSGPTHDSAGTNIVTLLRQFHASFVYKIQKLENHACMD